MTSNCKLYFLIPFLFLSYSSIGQILNIEKSRLDAGDSSHWVGNISLTYQLINQQIKTQGGGIKANLAHVGQANDYILIGDISYLNSEGFNLLQNGYVHARAEMMKDHKLSYELFTQIQYDQVKGMQERFLIGGNLRWSVYNKDKNSFVLAAGTFYENEEWYWEEYTNDATITTKAHPSIFRFNAYFTYRTDINDNVYFNLTTYFQPKYTSIEEFRISGIANLNFRITKNLFFKNSFTLWYDNAPYVPIDQLNYTLKNGISYNF
ncbi:DUF481 domain-containing protein [Flammeovirga pectinis]|uniref:DUF481 domain-containing protein n=1 Tax=Flammeovirga pectinis TaxID=2494373 RepID=A0A3Q9FT23_9BACT|nr:DUF481 domain-containing protein [Flammeovirga pectinis]AZQ65326.1 DUF481 domain-containing protein [Flammeovirga pectinis]